MAIIRNERSRDERPQRSDAETTTDVEAEEEIDYTWHPNEDEFVSPLTSEQWAELLGDEAFAQSDAGRAVRCLREYGEPATFQQLSIRYRGTMGRYRRWLSEAAQAAGERFGVAAPQQDRFGMDEWWPLLYQTRNAGKPGAGIFEMALRPEVEEAFELIEEAERQAKRAENARQLKRIEQLERARQEERRRAAAPKAQAQEEVSTPQSPSVPDSAAMPAPGPVVAETDDKPSDPAPAKVDAPASRQTAYGHGDFVSVPMNRLRAMDDSDVPATNAAAESASVAVAEPVLPATTAFLQLMEQPQSRGAHYVTKGKDELLAATDPASPVDYALRYAERLREAFSLMRRANPRITLATIARELGDESVEMLQEVVNGQRIPTFAYLDKLSARVFVNVERLEVPDGIVEDLPIFTTMQEAMGTEGVGRTLFEDAPQEIAYVVDDSDDRRTGVIVRLSDTRCVLMTRGAVRGAARRGDNAQLEAFIRMVDELDGFARAHDVLRTSRQVTAADWNALESGHIWPGALLR